MSLTSNNRRVAVNTVVLYFRMLFCMLVSFFTTRVALNLLGVVDYGLVNVVGGVVSMFSFISITLSHSCSRFFSYDLGRQDDDQLRRTFSMMVLLFVAGAILLIVLLESIGLWYAAHKLVVPEGRESDVLMFFHMTVGSMILSWFAIPYSSLIVSYENMSLYSILSILDAVFKLVAVCLIAFAGTFDKLLFYGMLVLVVAGIHLILNYCFARIKYPVSKLSVAIDLATLKRLGVFNGWQLLGAFSWTSSEVFVNLLLNSFFGPIVNAARGVATQVMSGVFGFTQSFLTAVRPQIVKLWSSGDREGFYLLFKKTAKASYYLVLVIAVPLLFELDGVLKVWLRTVPDYAVVFTRLVIITALVNTFSHPIVYAAQAVGKVAMFELLGSGVRILVWPISWVALRHGACPQSVFVVSLGVTLSCVLIRFWILFGVTRLPALDFVKDVFVRMGLVTVIAFSVTLIPYSLLCAGIFRFVLVALVGVVVTTVAFMCLGLSLSDREGIVQLVKRRLGVTVDA